MHHLEPERAAPHLTVTAQPRAARQTVALRVGEIEEAQRQRAGAVAEPHQQLAAAAKHDLRQQHFAFDDRRAYRPAARRSARCACDPRSAAAARTARRRLAPCSAQARQALAPASARAPRAIRPRLGRRLASRETQDALHLDARAARQGRPRRPRRGPGRARESTCAMISLTLAKCVMSVRNTLSLTAFASDAAGGLGDRLEVVEHAADLGLDVTADQRCRWPDRAGSGPRRRPCRRRALAWE